MLLIPIDRKPDWKRPPIVTILLVLVNLFVFFAFQTRDNAQQEEVARFYINSRLPALEMPQYLNYLERDGQLSEASTVRLADNKEAIAGVFFMMEHDAPFMRALRADEIIRNTSPDYQEWKAQRNQVDTMLGNTFMDRYSFRPAYARPITFLTHFFMHGGLAHLFGNMLFLILLGYVVEAALGSPLYLVAYLICGLVPAFTDMWVHPNSGIYSIGASGAISGVMGAYAILFGWRKIRFFYWIGVHFNFFRAPAIIMFPAWLLMQVFELSMRGHSNVNYLAHISGLLAGGLLALIASRFKQGMDRDYLDEGVRAEYVKNRYAEGMRLLGAMETQRAALIFKELYEADPQNRDLLVRCYNLAKLAPASDDYHIMASRIFHLKEKDADTLHLQHRTYLEYMRIAQPAVRISPSRMLSLAKRFAIAGYLDDAEKIVRLMMKTSTELAPALLALGTAFARRGQMQKGQIYLNLLIARYAHTPEAEHARQLLQKQG